MKPLTKALLTIIALSSVAANAAGVDCKRPLSKPGYDTLAHNWFYSHNDGNAALIGGGMSRACEAGKEWRADGIPFNEAEARFKKLAWEWFDGAVGNQVADKLTGQEIAYSVYLAGLSGYNDVPMPEVFAPSAEAERQKAAAMAAAQAKIAAANAAAKDKAKAKAAADAEADDLLRGLSNGKNLPKAPQSTPAISRVDVQAHARKIQAAVTSRLKNASSYSGKKCDVAISLSRDALLLSANAQGGDPALCGMVLESLKTVTFPAFPDDATYNVLNKMTLDFRP